MKKFSKILSLLIAAMMICALCVTCVNATADGKVVIANSSTETTYKLFKVFDATIGANNAVSYTYSDPENFPENDYFDCNEIGTVTIKDGATDDDGNLIAEAVAFIEENLLPDNPVDEKNGNGKVITFEGLEYGYYFVSTGVGAAVSITTTTPVASIFDKNPDEPGPGPDPENPENPGDSYKYFMLDDEYVTNGTASIGDILDFYITFKAVNYETNDDGSFQIKQYKITDTSSGLKFDWTEGVTVTVDGNEVDTENIEITENTMTLTWATEDDVGQGETQTYTNIYASPVDVEVWYSAEVTAVGTATNVATITYKYIDDTEKTLNPEDPGNTIKNYEINLNKVDKEGNALTGAEFEIYDAAEEGAKITLYKVSDTEYRVATSDEIEAGTNITTVVKAGSVVIKGFGNDDYYLEETKQPDGYNILTERWSVTIYEQAATANVINNAGTILPGTGSIGTTIFVVLGSMIVLAAGVLLITNKRMGKEFN